MADRLLGNYWAKRLDRRRLLRAGLAGSVGASVYLLTGCGGSNNNKAPGAVTTAPTVAGSPAPRTAGASPAAQAGAASPSAPKASATSGGAARALPVGGSLIALQGSDPSSFDPPFGVSGYDHAFFWMVHDNLVNYNQKAELDPSLSLAEKWEQADPTTIVLHLRSGVTFHDGTPFDGDAVKFNIQRAQSEKSAARAQMAPITRVEVTSPTEVRLFLDAPNGALLTLLGDRGGGIVSPMAANKFGDQLGRNPVGTGKFIFKEWVQSDHITVTKNPKYWGVDAAGTKLPYLDQIRVNIVPDPSTQVANLQAGTADVIDLVPGDVASFKKDSKFQVQQSAIGTGWNGTYVNQAKAPLDDLHLRRAIGRAINKAAIVQAVTFGLGSPGVGPIAIGTWAYNPSLKGLDFDLAEAKKELAASATPTGAKAEVVTVNTSVFEQHAELWQQMLKQIGFDLTVTPGDATAVTNRMFVAKEVPMLLAGYSLRADPDGTISDSLRSNGFYNPGQRPNPELDQLIDKARQSYDQQQRKSIYDQVQQIAIDQVYDWYVYYAYAFCAGQQSVLNLEQYYGGETKQRYANLAKRA